MRAFQDENQPRVVVDLFITVFGGQDPRLCERRCAVGSLVLRGTLSQDVRGQRTGVV